MSGEDALLVGDGLKSVWPGRRPRLVLALKDYCAVLRCETVVKAAGVHDKHEALARIVYEAGIHGAASSAFGLPSDVDWVVERLNQLAEGREAGKVMVECIEKVE